MIKKYCGVVRLIFFPLADFFYCVFGRFSIRGTQKRDKKKSRHRTWRKVQSWPNKARTYISCFFGRFWVFFSVAPWQLLGFDPDSLHFVTTCSFPPGSFLGTIQRLFFDVRYARSSVAAHRHIGAAYWLVTARLYNLKRPKSQFCSMLCAFCMIGIRSVLCMFPSP